MQLRSIILSALLTVAFGLPASAQSESAALIDFNNGDKRAGGTVVWRAEQVKTADGRDDLAIRADVDIPGSDFKVTMLLRRNLDPSVSASHLIQMTFTVPPDFIGGGMGTFAAVGLGPAEMSITGAGLLLGQPSKTHMDAQYVEWLSDKPGDICHNLAVLNDNAWLFIGFDIAKPKPNAVGAADQTLWFNKGESGQRVFDAVFAAWEKTPEPDARSVVCERS